MVPRYIPKVHMFTINFSNFCLLLTLLSYPPKMLKIYVTASIFATATNAESFDAFEAFKLKYNKTYKSNSEDIYRRNVFHKNMNALPNDDKNYGVTAFAATSQEEFHQMAGLKITSDLNPTATPLHLTNPPQPIDWVAKGAVTSIKDQGICGSCWSFSATGAVEGQNFIKHGTSISLSEQELMDCDTHELDHGCHGGEPHIAMEWVINNTLNGNGGQASETTCKITIIMV